METIVFATNNAHKVEEVQAMLQGVYEIKSLRDLGFTEDIAETGTTFRENAAIKAKTVFEKLGKSCFAEDSGLEVDALDGAPGLYSARFAGEHGNHVANNTLLLAKLEGNTNRKANFISVICFYDGKETRFFEGKIFGHIATELKGNGGFGYDPLFIPDGYDQSFGQLDNAIKNKKSHRAISTAHFVNFLKNA